MRTMGSHLQSQREVEMRRKRPGLGVPTGDRPPSTSCRISGWTPVDLPISFVVSIPTLVGEHNSDLLKVTHPLRMSRLFQGLSRREGCLYIHEMKFTQLIRQKHEDQACQCLCTPPVFFCHFSTLMFPKRGSSREWLAQSPRRSLKGGSLVAAQPLKP